MWILKLERSLLKKLRVTTWVIGLGFFPFSAVVAQMTFTEVASEVGVQFHQEAETQVPIGGRSGLGRL